MPTTEKTFDLAPGACWVPELKIRCPFLVSPKGSKGYFCQFFDVYLQDSQGLKGQRIKRCPDCRKQWQSHLTVSIMPA